MSKIPLIHRDFFGRSVHAVAPDETALTIAKAYLDVTDVYQAKDLAGEIGKHAPNLTVGARVEIPRLLSEPYRSPEEDRLRWPAERALKGVYISGIFAGLLPKFIETQVWHALLESAAAEHSARMTAMDAATTNASDVIESLTLHMNKVRQAAITREIIEVVSGASA